MLPIQNKKVNNTSNNLEYKNKWINKKTHKRCFYLFCSFSQINIRKNTIHTFKFDDLFFFFFKSLSYGKSQVLQYHQYIFFPLIYVRIFSLTRHFFLKHKYNVIFRLIDIENMMDHIKIGILYNWWEQAYQN